MVHNPKLNLNKPRITHALSIFLLIIENNLILKGIIRAKAIVQQVGHLPYIMLTWLCFLTHLWSPESMTTKPD